MEYPVIWLLVLLGGNLALAQLEYESSHHSNGCLLKGGACIPRAVCRGRAAIAFGDACDGPENDDIVCCIETHRPLMSRSFPGNEDSERSHPSADLDNICELRGGSCIPQEACPRKMASYDYCDYPGLVCCIERKIPRNLEMSESEEYVQVRAAQSALYSEEENPTCGQRSSIFTDDYRIVGGQIAEKGAWPWQVSLKEIKFGSHICGGIIIDKYWILTAAHCIQGSSPRNLQVVVGEHERYKDEHTESSHGISRIIKHESYIVGIRDHDIALIKLSKPISYTDWVQPICLPENESPSGRLVIVTGWGNTAFGGILSMTLRQVSVILFSNVLCKAAYGADRIKPGMICAGLSSGGQDSCNGDSGGPLVAFNLLTKVWEAVGVVSWGTSCGLPETPGVYTNTYFYLHWIKSKMIL